MSADLPRKHLVLRPSGRLCRNLDFLEITLGRALVFGFLPSWRLHIPQTEPKTDATHAEIEEYPFPIQEGPHMTFDTASFIGSVQKWMNERARLTGFPPFQAEPTKVQPEDESKSNLDLLLH